MPAAVDLYRPRIDPVPEVILNWTRNDPEVNLRMLYGVHRIVDTQ